MPSSQQLNRLRQRTYRPSFASHPHELVGFFTSAWQAATALILTTGEKAVEVPPAAAPRLELYIQNRHPEASGARGCSTPWI
jgi:hypothetical protein